VSDKTLSTKPSEDTHWEKAAKTRMGKYLTRLETNFITKRINFEKTRLIVDIGSEAGRFSMINANSPITVVAIDLDSYSLHRLKKKNNNVQIIQADARRIPVKDGLFDAVLMIEVLDYISELEYAIAECNRILKSGAPYILSFGNRSSLKAKLKSFRKKPYTHSYGIVRDTLRKAGFSIDSKLGYSWLPVGRISESRFVPLYAGLERAFGLRRLPSISPWVLIEATKKL
jgi:ubiquinone/menaquinone biosynthesis C-methylase UbiE